MKPLDDAVVQPVGFNDGEPEGFDVPLGTPGPVLPLGRDGERLQHPLAESDERIGGSDMVREQQRSPGLSTLTMSSTPARGSGKPHSEKVHTTASKDSSPNGSRDPSVRSNSTSHRAVAARLLASCSIPALRSTPINFASVG